MSLILNYSNWEELCQQAPKPQLNNLVLDNFEEIWGVPERFGQGYGRSMELSPGVWLELLDYQFYRDLMLKTPGSDYPHPFEMMILLSGYYGCSTSPSFSKTRSCLSGSGIYSGCEDEFKSEQRFVCVNVKIEPEVVESYFLVDGQCRSTFEKQLFKREDFIVCFYPKVTPAMRSLAYQMWNVPYRGAVKRMYLQAKAFELLALHLDLILEDPQQAKSVPKLKPKTVNALYHAKDILTTQLEHPPSLSQLAEQVGVSRRTLQRGFPVLFNTTVTDYLTQQRLDRAEMLLREGKHTITEVAILVGYGSIGHFSVAFKRKFGITPRQCLAGII